MVSGSLRDRARPGDSVLRRSWRRFRTIRGRRYAALLSAQAFTTLLPLTIVVATIAAGVGDASRFANWVIRFFHLTGRAREVVYQFLARPPDAAAGIDIIGDAFLVLGVFALAQLLRTLLEEAWALPRSLRRGTTLEALAAMLLLLGEVVLVGYLTGLFGRGAAGLIVGLLIRTGFAGACWLVIQWLLVDRRVTWRRLVAGAVVLAVAQTLISEVSTIVMPGVISGQSDRYGIVGVALALLSWLTIVCTVLAASSVIGAELAKARDRAPHGTPPAP